MSADAAAPARPGEVRDDSLLTLRYEFYARMSFA